MRFLSSAHFLDTLGRKIVINPIYVSSVVEYEDGCFVEIFMTGGECHAVREDIFEVMQRLENAQKPDALARR